MEEEKTPTVSLQDDSVRNKIRVRYVKGEDVRSIVRELGISENTWDSAIWRNSHGLRDFFNDIKRERFLMLAEKVSEEVMSVDPENNAKLLAIKQKEAEFLRETLGKDTGYSKRLETIGINISKTEPLDAEQKAKLDKIIRKAGQDTIKDVELVDVTPKEGSA